jgi:ribosomal protein L40E
MAFFEHLGKKVSEAAQVAAKKSSELVEVTKLNSNINSEENKIKELYQQIGKNVYEKFVGGEDVFAEANDTCLEIKSKEEIIAGLKQKILEIRNIKLCEQCGAELSRDTAFCSKCGAKQKPLEQPGSVEEDISEEKVLPKFCGSCGNVVEEGSVFCQKCGAKI